MKLSFYLLVALMVVSLVQGCCRSAFDADVARAEVLMESAPDSALAIAGNLSPSGEGQEARAALALLKARYKAYVPLTDDSLAHIAADYFTGDDTLAAQAQFFLGDTYFNLNRYDRALLAAKTGQDIADRIGDNYYAGLLGRLQADVYEACYDLGSERLYRQSAIENFKKAGKSSHEIWERLSFAKVLSNSKQMDSSLRYLDELAKDTVGMIRMFHASFRRARVLGYYWKSDYDSVVSVYNDVHFCSIPKDSYDWAILADSYAEVGNLEKSRQAVDTATLLSCDYTDTLREIMAKRTMARVQGDYETAYSLFLQNNTVLSSHQDSLLTHPFNHLLAETYELQAKSALVEARTVKSMLIFSIVTAILSIVIASLIFVLAKRTAQYNRTRINRLTEELNFLGKTLAANSKEIGRLSDERIVMTEHQVEVINILCSEIYRMPSTAKDLKKVLQKFDNIIDNFRTAQMQCFLEGFLNTKYDGIVSSMNAEYPNMNARQRTLFVYCALGFSNDAIAILMEAPSMNSLLVAKSRLKKSFLEHVTNHTDLLIKLLSTYKKGV